MKRSDFDFVDPRPLVGAWFEKKVDKIQQGEGKVLEKEVIVLCQTFDKGNTISEKLLTPQNEEALKAEFRKEWAEFEGQPTSEPEAPIAIDSPKKKRRR